MASFDLHLSWLTRKLGVMLSPIMSKSPVSKRAGVIQLRVQGSATPFRHLLASIRHCRGVGCMVAGAYDAA